MILSVWRYSHLTLAISSFLLLTVASITGIFLAFEPVIEKAHHYKTDGFDRLHLAQTVSLLKEKYPGIQEISIDDNQFVLIKYAQEEGGDQQAYADPATGKILGIPQPQPAFFQWMTALHRSLFLHETGRILIGISAFLLILIAVLGVLLVVQRQNGWRHFFSVVEKTGFAQYYHVVFGRLSLFFILAIALTGTYIAVYRFLPAPENARLQIDESQIREEPLLEPGNFPVFIQTPLNKLQKLQYPFSEFPEDYYYVQLRDRELCVNQFTGDILSQTDYSKTYQLADFSLRWHTGRSGTVWALILALASAYILFFIYSGFAITLKRRRGKTKNRFKAKHARIVLLVGSENGATFKFADAIYRQLIKQGEKAFITDLSNYTVFPHAEQLIIMTSTYGQGDPPSNAKKLAQRIKLYPQVQDIQYSIVGFGSRSYSHFCQFAFDIQTLLENTTWATEILPVYTVNDKSPQDFSDWITAWTRETQLSLILPRELLKPDRATLKKAIVVDRTERDVEDCFMIRFQCAASKATVSGDLMAIYPGNDHRERLYSIGRIDKYFQLSVKLHKQGLGSDYLNHLQPGEQIPVKFIKNRHFRFPGRARQIIMVSNGTGIAPFLGMINENRRKIPTVLYCGFRNRSSFILYEPFLKEQLENGRLSALHLVLSRAEEKEYVSHRLLKNGASLVAFFKAGGVIMLCGSLSMQHDVLKVLEDLCSREPELDLEKMITAGKILTDCY
ncbi:PepSY domain-containing protein [Niabella terrae]